MLHTDRPAYTMSDDERTARIVSLCLWWEQHNLCTQLLQRIQQSTTTCDAWGKKKPMRICVQYGAMWVCSFFVAVDQVHNECSIARKPTMKAMINIVPFWNKKKKQTTETRTRMAISLTQCIERMLWESKEPSIFAKRVHATKQG